MTEILVKQEVPLHLGKHVEQVCSSVGSDRIEYGPFLIHRTNGCSDAEEGAVSRASTFSSAALEIGIEARPSVPPIANSLLETEWHAKSPILPR